MYILSGTRYRKYLKEQGFKYIPNFLISQIKPRILGEITKGETIVGRVLGINTIEYEKLSEKGKELYIKALLELKSTSDSKVYFEDAKNFESNFLETLVHDSKLDFKDGYRIRMYNIPFIIKEMFRGPNKHTNSSDILIISSNVKETLEVIQSLIDSYSFFTVIGLEDKERAYDEILNQIGVSIFQPTSIDKIIKNYGIIINFCDNPKVEFNNIRNEALIIDFSNNKPFKSLENSKKNVILIEDICIKVENYNHWISKNVSPPLFEALGEEDCIFSKIYTNNEFYNPSDFVKISIKRSGRI